MNLDEARTEFRKRHPNLRVNGWDERDYELASQIGQLPSYGMVYGTAEKDTLVSRHQVTELLKAAAESRFERSWAERFGPLAPSASAARGGKA